MSLDSRTHETTHLIIKNCWSLYTFRRNCYIKLYKCAAIEETVLFVFCCMFPNMFDSIIKVNFTICKIRNKN